MEPEYPDPPDEPIKYRVLSVSPRGMVDLFEGWFTDIRVYLRDLEAQGFWTQVGKVGTEEWNLVKDMFQHLKVKQNQFEAEMKARSKKGL